MAVNMQLSQRRQKLSLTHDEVASLANISRAYYTNIEAGRKTPSMRVAKRIADALKTDVNQIFFASNVPNRNEEDRAINRTHVAL
ncbi:helix-turn-helix transcriptional regulator [Alicyclobacillus dauci]|uniref:Helix-turn-helix transcriptional regulator n=1 Tax=Alicyclobacillus dauci TaxID=1475485 RepID=A0ABY6Z6Q9_9BACL|nr:helix-turn-helix transcriptional regulator [Alicyclobacillus dauci]WAH38577.1 helix-turn-helix transcriptional regulator [Alicyclobacillus dauci]